MSVPEMTVNSSYLPGAKKPQNENFGSYDGLIRVGEEARFVEISGGNHDRVSLDPDSRNNYLALETGGCRIFGWQTSDERVGVGLDWGGKSDKPKPTDIRMLLKDKDGVMWWSRNYVDAAPKLGQTDKINSLVQTGGAGSGYDLPHVILRIQNPGEEPICALFEMSVETGALNRNKPMKAKKSLGRLVGADDQ